jgi:alpha-D-xyloside xylohydrolase
LPLFVRAGSIVPMGPAMEFSSQSAANPIELRVYPGPDADFTLYEDDGLTYDYEKGDYSTIPMHWDDA